MSFDNLCKLLSEKHPATFASWVLGTPQTYVKVLKNELSIELIRADYVTFLQLQGRILYLEFQTKLESTLPQALLQTVVEKVNQLEPRQRPEIPAYTQILAGLKYNQDLIRQLFREGMMRESVIYQEILAEGEQRGEQRERALILRQLTRPVGELPQEVLDRIETLSLEELENLGEALLDFQAMPTAVNYADLETWFRTLDVGVKMT
ncbi:MAG: DUF4351 domain-containing protein [Nostoc sp.]|uniref:DUF4351 domain-containing protein n=1 Tax=Nostoc sp. TaxID=1180 RepID=UPI002FF74F4B